MTYSREDQVPLATHLKETQDQLRRLETSINTFEGKINYLQQDLVRQQTEQGKIAKVILSGDEQALPIRLYYLERDRKDVDRRMDQLDAKIDKHFAAHEEIADSRLDKTWQIKLIILTAFVSIASSLVLSIGVQIFTPQQTQEQKQEQPKPDSGEPLIPPEEPVL